MEQLTSKDQLLKLATYEHYTRNKIVIRAWAIDAEKAGGGVFSACTVSINGGRIFSKYFDTSKQMIKFLTDLLFPKVPFCASCLRGERHTPADFKMRGFRYADNGRKIPYRGNLCDDCCVIYTDEGYHLRVVREYPEA